MVASPDVVAVETRAVTFGSKRGHRFEEKPELEIRFLSPKQRDAVVLIEARRGARANRLDDPIAMRTYASLVTRGLLDDYTMLSVNGQRVADALRVFNLTGVLPSRWGW